MRKPLTIDEVVESESAIANIIVVGGVPWLKI